MTLLLEEAYGECDGDEAEGEDISDALLWMRLIVGELRAVWWGSGSERRVVSQTKQA